VRVAIDDGDVRLSRMYPTGQQDIFAGQDLVLLARYEGSGRAHVVVTGRAGDRAVRWTSERNFAREDRDNAFVPRLWATQRLGWLAAEKRRNGGNAEIDDEIRRLGERFGIPTEFTSYLVLEPGMVANGPAGVRPERRRLGDGANRLSELVVTGSAGGQAPPSAPTTFEAAKVAAEQRAATSLAAADAAAAQPIADSASVSRLKRAGTRMFRHDGESWTDLRATAALKVYKVQAYSRTYFALVEKLPELREAFAVGERVKVAGKSVVVEVVATAAELTDAELDAIIRNW
jgi:hypothetical protein